MLWLTVLRLQWDLFVLDAATVSMGALMPRTGWAWTEIELVLKQQS